MEPGTKQSLMCIMCFMVFISSDQKQEMGIWYMLSTVAYWAQRYILRCGLIQRKRSVLFCRLDELPRGVEVYACGIFLATQWFPFVLLARAFTRSPPPPNLDYQTIQKPYSCKISIFFSSTQCCIKKLCVMKYHNSIKSCADSNAVGLWLCLRPRKGTATAYSTRPINCGL